MEPSAEDHVLIILGNAILIATSQAASIEDDYTAMGATS
jgi:hypothetical protein